MEKIDCFDGEYAFLSNFYPTHLPVMIKDDQGRKHQGVFTSTEALFQGSKVFRYEGGRRVVPTESEVQRFLAFAGMTPGKAKREGRKVEIPDVQQWNMARDNVMAACLKKKFSDPSLAKALMKTGNANLIEGNTWNDRYWGVCNGEGENRLGKLLMKQREILQKEQEKKHDMTR